MFISATNMYTTIQSDRYTIKINITERNSGYGLAMRDSNREQFKERNFFVNGVKCKTAKPLRKSDFVK